MIAAALNSNVWVVALAGAISFGVPLTLAALGEILAERSGVLNLGVEGHDADRRSLRVPRRRPVPQPVARARGRDPRGRRALARSTRSCR